MKIEQRKVRVPEWEPQVKWTALPASPIYTEQAQEEEEKTYKKRSQNWAFSLFYSHLCFSLPSTLEDVFSFACQIKLSCNNGPPIASNFCCSETEPRKLQTSLVYVVLFLSFNLAETTLARPLQGRGQAQQEAKHSRSPLGESSHSRRWTQRKPSAVEETRSPAWWELG